MNEKESRQYFALFIRIWRDGDLSPWRVVIEDPHSGEKHTLDSLAALFEFISGLVSSPP